MVVATLIAVSILCLVGWILFIHEFQKKHYWEMEHLGAMAKIGELQKQVIEYRARCWGQSGTMPIDHFVEANDACLQRPAADTAHA